MKKQLFYLLIGLFISLNASGFNKPETDRRNLINDGPYFFYVNNNLKVKWIQNNIPRQDLVTPDNFEKIKKRFHLLFDYNDLKNTYLLKPEFNQDFSGVDSIVIITDIHGEYNTYRNLLKRMGIIDDEMNWKFGKGHLVVIGDIFDRGKMVTEVLWHLFGLEKQAAEAGGMVHLLLGNHEFMMLSNQTGYLNEKYKRVEEIMNTDYHSLYSDSSVLGRWLRLKPVVITINDVLFVHAGISIDMVHRKLKIDQVNRDFYSEVLRMDLATINKDEELDFLVEDNGPIWYRGYFTDTSFCEARIDSILRFYGKNHIVIGHTPHQGIMSLYSSKIIGTDTGIMYRQPEEMLIYKNGLFYKCYPDGKRILLR